MDGGDLIHSGDYGCIINTFPACSKSKLYSIRASRSKGARSTRRINKIMNPKDPQIKSEIAASIELSKVPNYQDHFILIDEACEGDDITGDPDWGECGLFRPGQPHLASFVQLRMTHGGERLSDYALRTNLLIDNWLNLQIKIAESVRIIHARNWVHGDIHIGNIVIDNVGVPRIIDFGLSYDLGKLKEKDVLNMTFLPSYDNYAPELDFIAASRMGVPTQDIIDQIFRSKRLLDEINDIFVSRHSVYDELNRFVKNHSIKNSQEAVKFIKHYGKAGDMWTLGFNFYKLYMLLLSVPAFLSSKFYIEQHLSQMDILRGLLHVDPRLRFTIDDLLTQLYTIRMDM